MRVPHHVGQHLLVDAAGAAIDANACPRIMEPQLVGQPRPLARSKVRRCTPTSRFVGSTPAIRSVQQVLCTRVAVSSELSRATVRNRIHEPPSDAGSNVVCVSGRSPILVPLRFCCVGCSALAGRRRLRVWISTRCRSQSWSVCTRAWYGSHRWTQRSSPRWSSRCSPATSPPRAHNEACRSEGWHPPDAGTPARGTHCRASSSAGVATARGGFRQACIPTKTRRRREFFRGPGLGAVAAGRSGWGGVSGG
jgi:hypothetical protein